MLFNFGGLTLPAQKNKTATGCHFFNKLLSRYVITYQAIS